MKTFAERLIALRQARGMSQTEMAHLLRVTRNYVSMLEGGREPGPKLVECFEALERAQHHGQHGRDVGMSVLRETPPQVEDWMTRALLAEDELARLRHKLAAFQSLLGADAEPDIPARREVRYTPKPKAPKTNPCAVSRGCPEECPILSRFDHREKPTPPTV